MEDVRIIELYYARDEQAIHESDRKYGRLCFRIAQNILRNREDSEECVNDTWLGAWNAVPPARPNSLKAFLCKITRNLSLKKWEYLSAKKRMADDLLPFSELEELLPDLCFAPDRDDEEIGKAISNFLRGEKEEVRTVFLRRYWFCDSIAEIAERYSYSESKVKNMLYHARIRLRKYLEKEGITI